MRKISASYIVSNVGTPLKNGILVLDVDNSIIELIDRKGSVKEIENLEYYSGVIVPGFVDTFSCISWPKMNSDAINSENLLSLDLGEVGDQFSIQKAINHLEAFGTKGAIDLFPVNKSKELKSKSSISFRDVYEPSNKGVGGIVLNPSTTLGRLFSNNISLDKSFCIGTGSLTTHKKLSVFEELKLLQLAQPEINLEILIKWACLNGSEGLGFKHLGSFEAGKTPGLNLITNIDYEKFCLKSSSQLKVLI